MSMQSQLTQTMSELEALDRADVLHGFANLHAQATSEVVVVSHASGMKVTDQRGREFLPPTGR